MTIKLSNKHFGYLVLLLFFFLIGSVLGYAFWIFLFPKETRIIVFHRLGNLRIDDPVKIKGATVGKVTAIKKDPHRVLVFIQTYDDLEIYQDYKIFSTDKGIMGDRVIIVDPGAVGSKVLNRKDTLSGVFYPGVSEVLGSAWKMKKMVNAFRTRAESFFLTEELKPSLITQYKNLVVTIDTISIQILRVASHLQESLKPQLDTLNNAMVTTKNITNELVRDLPHKLNVTKIRIDYLLIVTNRLDSVVDELLSLVMTMQEKALPEDTQLINLMEQLQEIQNSIRILYRGTLQFKWRLKFEL